MSGQTFSIGFCICFLMTCALFAFDMYYPALPKIAEDFVVSSGYIQLSVTLYFFPLAVSQLFFGPLSDRYGRKNMLFYGTVFACLGSFFCALATNSTLFFVGRAIQGVGVGSYYTLTRAVMRDIFTGSDLARFSSMVSAVVSISPCFAPVVGSYCETFFGWQSIFILLSALFICCAVCIFIFLPSGNFAEGFETKGDMSITRNLVWDYRYVLKNSMYMRYLFCSSLAYSGLVIFLSVAPFIFEKELCICPIQFAYISMMVMGGLTVGSCINSYLVMKYKLPNLIVVGGLLIFASGIGIFLCTALIGKTVATIVIPAIFFGVACNIVFPNASACALSYVETEYIGVASAVFGCGQIIGPALASASIILLPISYIYILSGSFMCIGAIVLYLMQHFRKPLRILPS